MKVRVNPLVLAAALGLLGPAALEDEEKAGPVGLWLRTGPQDARPAGLGDRIEVLAIEDRVFIDEGLGAGLADAGSWTRLDDGVLVQELRVEGATLRREFRAEEGSLAVRTQLHDGEQQHAFETWYTRLG